MLIGTLGGRIGTQWLRQTHHLLASKNLPACNAVQQPDIAPLATRLDNPHWAATQLVDRPANHTRLLS
eukprot:4581031-Amphidinium_carterae.1